MVRVQGRMQYADKSGYAKIDEYFRTKKQADKFLKFLSVGKKGGAEKGTKITEYRKPKSAKLKSQLKSAGYGLNERNILKGVME